MPDITQTKMRYVKRFGSIAVQKGYITVEQLIEAITIQVKDEAETGSHRLLGSILFERDALTGDQLQEVINSVLDQSPMAA